MVRLLLELCLLGYGHTFSLSLSPSLAGFLWLWTCARFNWKPESVIIVSSVTIPRWKHQESERGKGGKFTTGKGVLSNSPHVDSFRELPPSNIFPFKPSLSLSLSLGMLCLNFETNYTPT